MVWIDFALVLIVAATLHYWVEPILVGLSGSDGLVAAYLVPRGLGLVVMFTLAAMLIRWRRIEAVSLGISSRDPADQVIAGLLWFPLAYISLLLAAAVALLLHGMVAPLEIGEPHDFLSRAPPRPDATIFVVILVAAAYEELIFRGLLLSRLRRALGGWPAAIVIVSVLFAWEHVGLGIPQLIAAFMLSITWSIIFIRTGSLVSCTVAHATFNLSQLFIVPRLYSYRHFGCAVTRYNEMTPWY